MNDRKTVDELLNEFNEVTMPVISEEEASKKLSKKEQLLKRFTSGGTDAPFKETSAPSWEKAGEQDTFYTSTNGLIVKMTKKGSNYNFVIFQHDGMRLASFDRKPMKGPKVVLPLVQEMGKKFDFSMSKSDIELAFSMLKQYEVIMISDKIQDILKPAYK